MQKIILTNGRITKDPEIKVNGSDKYVNFTYAINRRKAKDGSQNSDFIPCVAWNQTAELIQKYIKKGDAFNITDAEIRTRSYDDPNQYGHKIFVTELLVKEIEFIATNNKNEKPQQESSNSRIEKPLQESSGLNISRDDLPF